MTLNIRGFLQSVTDSVDEIANANMRMVSEALEMCGFDEEYIRDHRSDFRILKDTRNDDEIWHHRGKEIFRIVKELKERSEENHYQTTIRWYIKFPEVKDI